MTSSDSDERKKRSDNYHNICLLIGAGLVEWQHIEDVHFKIFLAMLKAPLGDVSSVVYYSVESFESRHKMVSRMAVYFLVERHFKKQRAEWQELEKLVKDANENRNKLAHYSMDFDVLSQQEMPDGSIIFDFGPHRLRPNRWNYVSRLLGHTKDKEEHNLGPEEISEYITEFRQLTAKMELFHVSLNQQIRESPSATEPRLLGSLSERPPTPAKSPPEDGTPSGA